MTIAVEWNAWLTDTVEGACGAWALLLITCVGLYFVTKVAFGVLRWFWRLILRPSINLDKLGKWSVVTGATDGIGKAMALQLARKGQHLVIISRTQSKLDATAQELKAANQLIQVKTLQVDFAQIMDFGVQERIAKDLGGLDIGVLINNVGISYPHAQYLEELEPQRLNQLVQLNCAGTAVMSKLVIAGMKERGRGAIINVSSAAGTVPQPLYVGYGAAKAFVDKFSKDLKREVSEFGIKVQSQIPMFVSTNLQRGRKLREGEKMRTNWMTPSPAGYAKWAVGQIGYDSPIVVSPHPVHSLIIGAINALPCAASNAYVGNMHKNIRRKALKKKSKAR